MFLVSIRYCNCFDLDSRATILYIDNIRIHTIGMSDEMNIAALYDANCFFLVTY